MLFKRKPAGIVLFAIIVLAVAASPVMAQLVTNALALNWDANQDQDGNVTWESMVGVSDYDWAMGANVGRSNATGVAGITYAYDFPTSGTANGADRGSGASWVPLSPGSANGVSLEFWLKTDTIADSVVWETGGATDGSSLVITNGNYRFTMKDNDDNLVAEFAVPDNTAFHQLAAVYDAVGNNLTLYLDGVAQTTTNMTFAGSWSGSDAAAIGGSSGSVVGGDGAGGASLPNTTYDGQVGVVRFYNDALSATAVSNNYLAVTATSVAFTGPSGSDWSTQSAWNTGIDPTSAQDVFVTNDLTANITQSGEAGQQVYVGGATTGGKLAMSSGTLDVNTLNIGNDSTGEVELNGGTVKVNSSLSAVAIAIGASGGSTATMAIDGATVEVRNGRFEIGTADNVDATLNMKSGDVTVYAQNLILGQGNDNSNSTNNFSGGTFEVTGNADYNINDGTAVHNHSGGTLTIGDQMQLQTGGAGTTFTLNQTGGTISVDDIAGRNGDSTLNVVGGTLEVRANGIAFGNNTGRSTILNVGSTAGSTGLVTVAGDLTDGNTASAMNLSGAGRLELIGSATTRDVDNLTMSNNAVLQLDVVDSAGVSAALNAKTGATIDDTPTIELRNQIAASASSNATWTGGTAVWDTDGAKWDVGVPASIALNTITNGQKFDVITSAAAIAGAGTVSSGTAGWQMNNLANAIEAERTGLDIGGAATALIGDSASIVTRNSDLNINTTAGSGADAAGLVVSNGGSLTLSGGNRMILGVGNGQGDVSQSGGAVAIGGDLLFGTGAGDKGGVYHITGGSLAVGGDVLEVDNSVGNAQLYIDVDGGVTVDGDISVQSFRVGQDAGNTGSFTIGSGQSLSNSGTLYAGNLGDGTLTVNDGGSIIAGTTVIGEGATGRGTLTINSGATVELGAVSISDSAADQSFLDIKGGTVSFGGAVLGATSASGNSKIEVGVGGGAPVIAQTGGNLDVANAGTGTFTMASGSYTMTGSSGNLVVGQGADSVATFTLNGGSFTNFGDDLNMNNGKGTVNINAGSFSIGDDINLANGTSGDMVINIGTGSSTPIVKVDDILARTAAGATNIINFKSGTLISRVADGAGVFDMVSSSSNTFNWTGGTLSGFTLYDGELTQDNTDSASKLIVGSSIGEMTVNGGYSIDGGVLQIEIDGTNGAGVAGGFDLLTVNGAVALDPADALLELIVNGTFGEGDIGTEFVFLANDDVDAVGGTFQYAEGASITNGNYTFNISYLGGDGNDVSLSLAAIPEPATLGLIGISGALLLAIRRKLMI